ncbi:hypothetical protein WAH63_20150, partial [Acinetobacter baumannii]
RTPLVLLFAVFAFGCEPSGGDHSAGVELATRKGDGFELGRSRRRADETSARAEERRGGNARRSRRSPQHSEMVFDGEDIDRPPLVLLFAVFAFGCEP